MKLAIYTIILLTCAGTTNANTQIQRIENASETFVRKAANYARAEIPEINSVMPAIDWDDDWRRAARCILDGLAHEHGNIWVSRFVATAETYSDLPFTGAVMVRDAPAEFRSPLVARLSGECGLIGLALERAAESGLVVAITTIDLGKKFEALR